MLWAAFTSAIRPLRSSPFSSMAETHTRTNLMRNGFHQHQLQLQYQYQLQHQHQHPFYIASRSRSTGTYSYRYSRTTASSSSAFWLTAASLAMMSCAFDPSSSVLHHHHHHHRHHSDTSLAYEYTHCQEADSNEDEDSSDDISTPPFPEKALTFDHYNGVLLDLGQLLADADADNTDKNADSSTVTATTTTTTPERFPQDLANALTFWRAEGRKGIWIRVPASQAKMVPVRRNAKESNARSWG
jgi:hypothetical protein